MTPAKKASPLSFIKFQAAGNDFVLLDAVKQPLKGFSALAKKLCDRHFGVGADGLLVVLRASTPKAEFRMRMFNLDGSEDMCGNGLRCIATYLYNAGYARKTCFHVQTHSGLRVVNVSLDNNGKFKSAEVNLGRPLLKGKDIPVSKDLDQVINYPLKISGRVIPVTALSTGTPHAVVFTSDTSEINSLGQKIMQHPFFPEQVSVSFVKLTGNRLHARTWERGGVGESLSCGTGAAAILVSANLKGLAPRKAEINYPGGKLRIRWDDNDDLWLSGLVKEVFRGTLNLPQVQRKI